MLYGQPNLTEVASDSSCLDVTYLRLSGERPSKPDGQSRAVTTDIHPQGVTSLPCLRFLPQSDLKNCAGMSD
jgi:hypothetical protein